jgi:SAM-dependent methyltransferase
MMPNRNPAPEIVEALTGLAPGRALDLACGAGRHARWLVERGWVVTAVDQDPGEIECATAIRADLEKHEFKINPNAWDLIVCWLYWQPDLLSEIARGVRAGGVVAMAGKTSGRFATSLRLLRAAFTGWREIASGENESRAFLIAQRPGEELVD